MFALVRQTQATSRFHTSTMTIRSAAARYARALFDVTLNEKGDPAVIEQQLAAVVEVLTSHDALRTLLENPAFPAPRKRALVAELLTKMPVESVLRKLLLLLAERDRVLLAPMVLDLYRTRVLDYRNVVRAEVTTATPHEAGRAAAIEAGLARLTGKAVLMTTKTDPDILGGVVTRLGGTVYDGSLRRQLERVRQALTNSQ